MTNSGGFAVTRTQPGDRFYNPPPLRRHNQVQHQLSLQQQQQQRRRVAAEQKQEDRVKSSVELEPRTESDESTLQRPNSAASSDSLTRKACWSNLDRLMESVTPCVPAHYFSEVKSGELKNREADLLPFFRLGDLFESYYEWSAYGAGVPLTLNGSDSITQYYVPSLSGMQLYVDKNRRRRPSEDRDAEFSKETNRAGSRQCETEKRVKQGSDGTSSRQNLINLNSQRMNGLTLNEKPGESEASTTQGQLIFEYMEQEQPYHRKPLYDKISSLTSQFPEISAYRSCDLLPSSWISIAWYPIYRIPTGPTLQNLDACFLTFHSLSTHSKGKSSNKDAASKICVPVFGLASYKLRGSILMPNGAKEWTQVNSLMQVADKFLQSLQVSHPDFQFFASHNAQWRC